MKTRQGLMAALAILLVPTPGVADEIRVPPSDQATVMTEEDGGLVLLQFELPQGAVEGRITRATLRYAVDCEARGGLAILAHRTPAAWDGQTVDALWWGNHRDGIERSGASSFELADCADDEVSLDLTRWVRAWKTGAKAANGIVLRYPDLPWESMEETGIPVPRAPVLVIHYRPGTPNE